MNNALVNRYDFVFLFDVKDANPNGDPDQGNLPRVDPEDQRGIITDVCLKRKVRDYVLLTKIKDGKPEHGFDIFIQRRDAVLNDLIEGAATIKGKGKDKLKDRKEYMCKKYFDIRTFGAVMSTGDENSNAGTVRGPVQFSFGRSLDRVFQAEHSITRCTVATTDEANRQKDREYPSTMGRKFTVPYALYTMQAYVSPVDAQKTEFSEDDLALLFEALKNVFEHDASAARGPGSMVARALIAFKHDNHLGRARSADLFELISIRKKTGVDIPRSFDDYEVALTKSDMPNGVVLDNRSFYDKRIQIK
jgi:CRISPR-associated protein Cas7/Csd2, subtype I-C/DVULG